MATIDLSKLPEEVPFHVLKGVLIRDYDSARWDGDQFVENEPGISRHSITIEVDAIDGVSAQKIVEDAMAAASVTATVASRADLLAENVSSK